VQRHPVFFSAALPKRVLPPMFNRYAGEANHYGDHVDQAIRYPQGTGERMRTDLSCTLFLCDPADYEGGELVIDDPFGPRRVKLPAGHLVLYPGTSVHRVEPVTRGARLASFFWIESLVRSDEQRRLLFDLDMNLMRLRQRDRRLRRDRGADRHVPQPAAPVGRHVTTPGAAAPSTSRLRRAGARGDGRQRTAPTSTAAPATRSTLRDNLAAWSPAAAPARAARPGGWPHPRGPAGPHAGPSAAAGAGGLPAAGAFRRRTRQRAGRGGTGRRAGAEHAVERAARTTWPAWCATTRGAGRCGSSWYCRTTAVSPRLLRRVEAAGFEALVLTVDAPVNGVRDRERRARLHAAPRRAASTSRRCRHLPLARGERLRTHWMAAGRHLGRRRLAAQQTRLPVLLKGVLHADDARQAVAQGAAG
jgi:hypothetical protein